MTTRVPTLVFVACATACLLTLAAPLWAADDPAQGAVWDLSPLFQDDQAWDAERISVEAALPTIAGLKDALGASAAVFLQNLDQISSLTQRVERLSEYADLKIDADARSDANQARIQEMSTLRSQFDQATSFVPAEILRLGRQRIEAFEAAEPGLARHRRKLELILRRAAHTL